MTTCLVIVVPARVCLATLQATTALAEASPARQQSFSKMLNSWVRNWRLHRLQASTLATIIRHLAAARLSDEHVGVHAGSHRIETLYFASLQRALTTRPAGNHQCTYQALPVGAVDRGQGW